ncbi:MAG: bacteriohopanetetrol glucosamine biosynthesis glycosyltransferase HpnI [Xanthobacteraceae bacterium]
MAAWASVVCYVAAALGCAYALFAAWAARRFGRLPTPAATDYPPVTLLKPLHGLEPDLYANLAGFCAQAYPSPVQIIFGVDDPADPAVGVVHKLVADFPARDLTLVINARRHGENRKISNLINMAREARHEVLIVSDSDIVVGADYLKHVAAALAQPGVGLVTCLYRGAPDAGLWSRLGAAAIDYQFLPNVLVGLKLGLAAPCFGSTIALRRETLAAIGGFEAVADQLADDYALGALVRRGGQNVAIPTYIVAHACSEQSARDLIRHELRWARTIRAIDPAGFAGLVITYALPLALIAVGLGGINPAGLIVIAALACRLLLQSEIDRAFHLRSDLFWLGPLRDILSFAIFVMSFFGRGVEWRGHRYGLRADNRLAYYGEVET